MLYSTICRDNNSISFGTKSSLVLLAVSKKKQDLSAQEWHPINAARMLLKFCLLQGHCHIDAVVMYLPVYQNQSKFHFCLVFCPGQVILKAYT